MVAQSRSIVGREEYGQVAKWEFCGGMLLMGEESLADVMFVFILNVVSERLPLSYVYNKHFQIWACYIGDE